MIIIPTPTHMYCSPIPGKKAGETQQNVVWELLLEANDTLLASEQIIVVAVGATRPDSTFQYRFVETTLDYISFSSSSIWPVANSGIGQNSRRG
jgi:hypothetical protein